MINGGEIKMRNKTNVLTFITCICIMPFTIALVYGMYKLTCLNDLYFIWLMASCLVMMFMFWELQNIKEVIIMMLYELLTRVEKSVPVKCMIRNEKSITTIEGSCNFVYNRLSRNGLASNVLYIDMKNDKLIVRAE